MMAIGGMDDWEGARSMQPGRITLRVDESRRRTNHRNRLPAISLHALPSLLELLGDLIEADTLHPLGHLAIILIAAGG